MGNYKWNTNENLDTPFVIMFMISRNKDNKQIEGFKERKVSCLVHSGSKRIYSAWEQFKAEAMPGETCRLYMSLNARNPKVVRKKLLHYLIDAEDIDLTKIEIKIVSFAAEKESALEHKWFFDFDSKSFADLKNFEKQIDECGGTIIDIYITPNGYAVVVEKGFDTRELLNSWGDIASLKRDDLILVDWWIKNE